MLDGMTRRVVEWTDAVPERVRTFLAKTAEGDEFMWGDDDLAEMIADALTTTPNALAADWMDYAGVDREEARRIGGELEQGAQEPPHWIGHVDWETVRNHLIGEGK